MSDASSDYSQGAEYLAARAISLYGTGEGDPLSTAHEAVQTDSMNSAGWTALALVEMRADSIYMDSLFSRAFALCSNNDPVLIEIYSYWLLSVEDYGGAAEHASQALLADSSFGPAWLTLSMALLDSGRTGEALQASEMSLEWQPGSLPLLHQYAQALEAAGYMDEALEAYSSVIEMDSLKISAYVDLAILYQNAKQDGQAVKVLRRMLEKAPEYAWGWGELAAVIQDMGRTDLADSFFTRSVDLDPTDSWALYRLAKLRSRTDPEMARDLLENSVAFSPDFSVAWQELAFVYETLDDMASAAAALERCVEIAPEAWLYGELGYVLESSGYSEEAAEAFEASVEMDSQYLYGWQRRGDVYLMDGDTLSAVNWFTDALSLLENEDPWITAKLGNLMAGTGFPDSAVVIFSRASELDPSNHSVWLDLARSLAVTGDYGSASASLDSSLAKYGDSLAVLAERLLILEALERNDEAAALSEEILARWPDAWIRAGWSALNSGFHRRALLFAEKAFDDYPEDPWNIISMAELFGDLGKPEVQMLCYRRASESPLRTADQTVSIANYYFRQDMFDDSIRLLHEAYSSGPWDKELATALAEAYLFDDQLDKAEDILLEVVAYDPLSVYAICYLGLIQENRGNPEAAAERYLEALRLEPGYNYAEDRLLFISGEIYDPGRRRNLHRIFDWNLWINLSSTGGNVDEQNFGGGGSITYNYGNGSSLGFETSGTAEIKNGEDLRRTAWASVSGEHFLSDHLYAGASTSWDRQPLTVRPWQVSSYVAGGWKSWPASWIWLAPETGAGLVSTKWSTSQERTDEWTVYISLSVWAMTEVKWLPSLWISGSVYIPPEDPSGLVASSVGELEFQLPGPLSLITGTSLDYTRTPVVESWENLDSEIYLRLRL